MTDEENGNAPARKGASGATDGSEASDGRARWQASLREAGPYLGMGFQLGGTVALFIGAGYLVDRWLGSLPWATAIGGVLGMVAAMFYIARVNRALRERSDSSSSSPSSSERGSSLPGGQSS